MNSKSIKMTTNIQQGTILDVLKKKMRQTKEEMEKYKEECEDYHKRLQVEVMRREEVSLIFYRLIEPLLSFFECVYKFVISYANLVS